MTIKIHQKKNVWRYQLLVLLHGNLIELTCICRLDVGDGKDVDLPECPRTLLKKQCIRYLGPVRNVLLWMAIYLKS
jgi:hypothetical protein